MKIKMLVGLAGNEYSLAPGDERDFPDGEAIRLVAAGYAVPAVAKKAEHAFGQPVTERRTKKGRADVVSREGDNSADG